MRTSLIVAMAQNGVIGNGNQIPWHIPEDFKYFKQTTMGKPMIMGRKTFESLPGILPGRAHIVVTRQPPGEDTQESLPSSSSLNVYYVNNMQSAIALAQEIARDSGQDEIFVIGGGQIYKQALEGNLIDRQYITRIHQDFEGDAFFPEPDASIWKRTSIQENKDDAYTYSYEVWERADSNA